MLEKDLHIAINEVIWMAKKELTKFFIYTLNCTSMFYEDDIC